MIKRLVLPLIVVLLATTAFAGGKSCEMKSGKSVELNGTLLQQTSGDHEKTVFKVANSDKSYTVCEKTKSSVLKLGNEGKDTLHVKGKIVNCGEGEELLIDTANKI
jgi:hypothetical protein